MIEGIWGDKAYAASIPGDSKKAYNITKFEIYNVHGIGSVEIALEKFNSEGHMP